jgi:hypothetical protein
MRHFSALPTGVALAGLALALSACGAPGDSASSGTPAPAGSGSSAGAASQIGSSAQAPDDSSAQAPGGSSSRGPGGAAAGSTRVDPVASTKQILAGKRQALIHIVEDDKDWSATYEGPIAIGTGTDDGARFRIIPSGKGRFLIEALRAREEGGRWCVNADTRDEPVSLGTVKCAANENTLFRISPTGKSDAKGRPTHDIINEKFGAVQVRNDGSALYIQEVGDGGTRGTYSFVDRGAVR